MFELTNIRISVCYSNSLPFMQSVTLSVQRNPRASSLSFKFNLLTLPRLKQGNLKEDCHTLTSFVRHHALCAWFCSEKRQSLLFSTHLFAKSVCQIKVHCHPSRSTPRFARRFTAPNDSHHYSTRFLRLGERAPNKGDPLSSSALHSALCASLCSFE